MVEQTPGTNTGYLHVKNIGGRDVVVAPRSNFKTAIDDGCIPFDAEELQLMNSNKVKLREGGVILLVKTYFPKAKLERVQCRTN